MSENKGKTKVKAKSKSKSTMKSAGKNKAAVMNSRNPKEPMAISGDTMSNYAMYKKGGKVKKYQTAGPVNTSGPRATPGDMNLTEVKNQYNSDKIKIGNKEKVNATLSGNEAAARNAKEIQQTASRKKGGAIKRKYKSGGSFPDLTGDGKVTRADILKGRGVIKKGGTIKSKSKKK